MTLLSHTSRLIVASGEELEVRKVRISEGVSTLFAVELEVVSANPDVEFDGVLGKPGSLTLTCPGLALPMERVWRGVVSELTQLRVEATGRSTYALTIRPRLWLASQGRNYRVFQNLSELDIARQLLREWNVPFVVRCGAHYARRSFVIQYGESDFAFLSRMLEGIGVAYAFTEEGGETIVELNDAFQSGEPTIPALPFYDTPPERAERWAREVVIRQRIRPGRQRVQDVDYRKPPTAQPAIEAASGLAEEQRLELVDFSPGAFLFEQDVVSALPGDDRGVARTDPVAGQDLVKTRLLAARSGARVVELVAPVFDLVPGRLVATLGHPSREVDGRPLLVVRSIIEGEVGSLWRTRCECVANDDPFKPPMITPKPRITGVESAVVVGPEGDDIHTDELGRVRVQFHWDREGVRDDRSSCWVVVNQPWGGAGFGALNLPRVGQEVLVEFVGGDPDRPVIMGRVFTTNQPVPYKLPDFKQLSGIRSATSNADKVKDVALGMTVGLLGGLCKALDATGLSQALQHPLFKAQSPDASTHAWSGNEMSFHDQPGCQQLYMQAERDMNVVVKNAQTSVIGNSRSQCIGTDDVLMVGNRQSQIITDDRSLMIGGNHDFYVLGTERHTAVGDLTLTAGANMAELVTEKRTASAKIFECSADELMVFKVGEKSRIVLRPDFIIIQATDVFINPGDADTDAAINTGARPTPDTERREAEAAALAARQAALTSQKGSAEAQDQREAAYKRLAEHEWVGNNRPAADYAYDDMVFEDYHLDPQYDALTPAEKSEYLSHNYGLDDADAAGVRDRLEAMKP